MKEQAGKPGWLDTCGLGTVVRSETGGQSQPTGCDLSHREGQVCGLMQAVWGSLEGYHGMGGPLGGRVENGLWRSRGDEGDKGEKGVPYTRAGG